MSEEKEQTTADDFAEQCIHIAMENFRRDGQLYAMAIIPGKEAMIFVPMDDFTSKFGPDLGKIAFGGTVRKILNDGDGADMVALVTETWVAKLDMENIDDSISPQAHIESMYEKYGNSLELWPTHLRGEQLMVSVETRDGEQLGYMVEIKPGSRELSAPERLEPGMTGRFTNWFNREPPTTHIEIPRKELN